MAKGKDNGRLPLECIIHSIDHLAVNQRELVWASVHVGR